MNAIEFHDVWKKFKKGEKFNSLRDAVPYYTRLLLSRPTTDDSVLEQREFWALKGLSFEVKKGDILGIIGPNGAGKSTVLKLLSKIMAPNRGSMRINGRLSALIEVTAGFHPELTGRENAYLNGTILGMSRKEIDGKFDEIVEFSGLREFINTPVKRYSSGMYSRLGFSVAAHMAPDILLVDEVLSVGDMAFQSKCVRKMKELLGSGATIILISHDMTLVQNLCKRVILVNEGTSIKEGTATNVIPYYQEIVSGYRESELRKEILRSDYKVRVNEETKIAITGVSFDSGIPGYRDRFLAGQRFSMRIDFEAKERIERPVFALEIIRSDGVLCCSSSSHSDGYSIESVEGRGAVVIELDDHRLAPGIYVIKISIWDKDMLHPYVLRKKDILRLDPSGAVDAFRRGVFLTRYSWKWCPNASACVPGTGQEERV